MLVYKFENRQFQAGIELALSIFHHCSDVFVWKKEKLRISVFSSRYAEPLYSRVGDVHSAALVRDDFTSQSRNEMVAEIKTDLERVNALQAQMVSSEIDLRLKGFTAMAGSAQIQQMDSEVTTAVLKAAADAYADYESIIILGKDGKVAIDPTGHVGMDLSERDYFKQAIQGQTFVSEPVISKASNKVITH